MKKSRGTLSWTYAAVRGSLRAGRTDEALRTLKSSLDREFAAREGAIKKVTKNLHSAKVNERLKKSNQRAAQVRDLVAKGQSPKKIADQLGISLATVYRKLRDK